VRRRGGGVVHQQRDLHRLGRGCDAQHLARDAVLPDHEVRGAHVGDGRALLVEDAHVEGALERLGAEAGHGGRDEEHAAEDTTGLPGA